jgi:hypothetical protein
MSDEKTEKKVVKKPINPLAAKPGQNYGTTKYVPSKEYEAGKITFKEEKDKDKDQK